MTALTSRCSSGTLTPGPARVQLARSAQHVPRHPVHSGRSESRSRGGPANWWAPAHPPPCTARRDVAARRRRARDWAARADGEAGPARHLGADDRLPAVEREDPSAGNDLELAPPARRCDGEHLGRGADDSIALVVVADGPIQRPRDVARRGLEGREALQQVEGLEDIAIDSARTASRRASSSAGSSRPATTTRPCSGRRMPASRWSNVVLPIHSGRGGREDALAP